VGSEFSQLVNVTVIMSSTLSNTSINVLITPTEQSPLSAIGKYLMYVKTQGCYQGDLQPGLPHKLYK